MTKHSKLYLNSGDDQVVAIDYKYRVYKTHIDNEDLKRLLQICFEYFQRSYDQSREIKPFRKHVDDFTVQCIIFRGMPVICITTRLDHA